MFTGMLTLILKYTGLFIGGVSSVYAAWIRAKGVEKNETHLRAALYIAVAGFCIGLAGSIAADRDASKKAAAQQHEAQLLRESEQQMQNRILTKFSQFHVLVSLRVPNTSKTFDSYFNDLKGVISAHLSRGHLQDSFEGITVVGKSESGPSTFEVAADSPHFLSKRSKNLQRLLERSMLNADIFSSTPRSYSRFAAILPANPEDGSLLNLMVTGGAPGPDLHIPFSAFKVTEFRLDTTLKYSSVTLSADAKPADISSSSNKLLSLADLKDRPIFLNFSLQSTSNDSSAPRIDFLYFTVDDKTFSFKLSEGDKGHEAVNAALGAVFGRDKDLPLYDINESAGGLHALRGTLSAR